MRVAECSLSLAGRFACSYAGCRGATGLWSLLLNYVAVNQAASEEGEGRGRAGEEARSSSCPDKSSQRFYFIFDSKRV